MFGKTVYYRPRLFFAWYPFNYFAFKYAFVCYFLAFYITTFYERLEKDSDFKKVVDDIKNVALDYAESKLYELIKDGNVTATIFYLKTKGKKRGYIERQEIAHEGVLESKVIEWVPSKE